jgi:outer membrane biosynthesis protein TonB
MRRQQFANTFVIMLFAVGIVALSALAVGRWHPWWQPPRPVAHPAPEAKPVPKRARVVAPVQAPVVPATVAVPIAVEPKARPTPASKPPAEPTTAKKPAPKKTAPAPVVRETPLPPLEEAVPSVPARSVFEFPGAAAAKRVLVSIKCFDQFEHEGAWRGRQHFSARCENSNRRSVSCLGGDCKIEYAPPPSHLP